MKNPVTYRKRFQFHSLPLTSALSDALWRFDSLDITRLISNTENMILVIVVRSEILKISTNFFLFYFLDEEVIFSEAPSPKANRSVELEHFGEHR